MADRPNRRLLENHHPSCGRWSRQSCTCEGKPAAPPPGRPEPTTVCNYCGVADHANDCPARPIFPSAPDPPAVPEPTTPRLSMNTVLYRLEEAMHGWSEVQLSVNTRTLLAAWRGILGECWPEPPAVSEAESVALFELRRAVTRFLRHGPGINTVTGDTTVDAAVSDLAELYTLCAGPLAGVCLTTDPTTDSAGTTEPTERTE